MPGLLGTVTGFITNVVNEVVDEGHEYTPDPGSAPRPPTAEEIKSWVEDVVASIADSGASAMEQLGWLQDTMSNEQLARLLFLQAILADAVGGTAIRDTVDFLFSRRLLGNRGVLEVFREVAAEEADWPPLLRALAGRRGNIDELLEAIDGSGQAMFFMRLLLDLDSSDAFRGKVLRSASRLGEVFGAAVATLLAQPHALTPGRIVGIVVRHGRWARRRTLVRLVATLNQLGLLNQVGIAEQLAALGRDALRAFVAAIEEAGLRLARKHPSDPAQRAAAWTLDMTQRLNSASQEVRQKAKFDVCTLRLALDTLVASANPASGNSLQAKASQRLAQAIPAADLQQVRQFASRVKGWIDSSPLLPRVNSAEELADVGVSAGGPLGGLKQALGLEHTDPDPWGNVDPFTTPDLSGVTLTGWAPACITRFENNDLPPATLQQMSEYFPTGAPGSPAKKVLPQAHVERVMVYDRPMQKNVREATTADKNLSIKSFDVRHNRGWESHDIPMAVGLDDERCLVLQSDPVDNLQVLCVDVEPAARVSSGGRTTTAVVNTVRVIGTGFISGEPRVVAELRPWVRNAVDDQGRLAPQATTMGPGLPLRARVFDSRDFPGRKEILFDWPDTASNQGLYKVTFRFQNSTGLLTVPHGLPAQDQNTCSLNLTADVETEALWFAVLPTPAAVNVKPVVSRVRCTELTDPKFWFDDVSLTSRVHINQVEARYNASGELEFDVAPVGDEVATDGGTNKFDYPGEDWDPAVNLFAASGDSDRLLGMDQVLFTDIHLWEIEGEQDRHWVRAILTALGIVLAIILSIVVIALFVVFVVFVWLAATGVILASATTGTAISVGTAFWLTLAAGTLLFTALGFIWGALLGAFVASFPIFTAVINGSEPLLNVATEHSGMELALRTSRVRYHRHLWLPERRDPQAPEMIATSESPEGVSITFRESMDGGTYRVFYDLKT